MRDPAKQHIWRDHDIEQPRGPVMDEKSKQMRATLEKIRAMPEKDAAEKREREEKREHLAAAHRREKMWDDYDQMRERQAELINRSLWQRIKRWFGGGHA